MKTRHNHRIKNPILRISIVGVTIWVVLCSFAFSIWNGSARSNAENSAVWQKKVDPQVLTLAAAGKTDFLVYLNEQADLSRAATLTSKEEKGAFVFKTLTDTARRSQASLIDVLNNQKITYRSYWIANMVWVQGDISAVQTMAQLSEVAHIYADPWVQSDSLSSPSTPIELANHASTGSDASYPSGIQWNIEKVNAPQVWAAGYTGQGVVIGGQDTGYQWDHPALKAKYRGWNGTSADHNYNWHDAIHEDNPSSGGENSCGLDLAVPCDDYGHGTHTMGIMVGDDGNGMQIGMAPGAQWIGCRNMEEGWGKPSTYAECFQWFVAPWPIGGDPIDDADPSKAPDVINNSWSCPPSEGCAWDSLQAIVNATRAAGIMVVGSAGNGGSSCGSVNNPIAIYDNTFTVGATDLSDNIADFSSRGPAAYTNLLKPDVTSPGIEIYSSIPGNAYANMSGTSMAAPHVSGLVALLISINPGLAGQVDTLEKIITLSAVPITTTQNCGGVPGSNVPNNTYGWGRINAYAAYQSVHRLTISKSASPIILKPGDIVTYTLTISHSLSMSPTTNVIITDILPENTLFITATTPFTYADRQVFWQLPMLAANEKCSMQLVVQLPITPISYFENHYYGVKSDDFLIPAMGEPNKIFIGEYKFFPLIFTHP